MLEKYFKQIICHNIQLIFEVITQLEKCSIIQNCIILKFKLHSFSFNFIFISFEVLCEFSFLILHVFKVRVYYVYVSNV